MKETNLLKIFNHFKTADAKNLIMKNPLYEGTMEVAYWVLPFSFDTGFHRPEYDYKKEIKLTNKLFQMVGFPEFSSEELQNISKGLGYAMMIFDFAIKSKNKRQYELPITFGIYPDSADNLYFTYCDKPVAGGSYLSAFKNMKPFVLENATENERYYYETMLQLSEAVCNKLEIATEENQGIFHKESASDQEAFDELVKLLNHDDYLSQEDITELKTDWQNIHQNREAFAQRLIDEGIWFEEDLEYVDTYETDYLMYWAFVEKFNVYRDDWKFDPEALGDFISENIGQKFEITFEECGNDSRIVSDKLEQESDYTLLDLTSGNDDCNFIIAKKQDKQRIYTLADQLGLWVD
ncbi:hypothetical protein DKB58_06480 [Capnocytophaga canimorsus]|uniref:DUF6630 family protein n=1 Tax=Capnocytophaga canimorsus TaxID=28188 RepID=UPI000D6DDE4E|nr:hypothetical protein [Capnocytophaga canimorsus]AWL78614.1 hypothetical protein DKB58_06480 [Capnocytophaga canimorsus]